MDIVSVILGAALLLLGRRLYWLAIGVLGFLAGASLAEQWLVDQSDLVILLVALAAGLLGAIIAVVFQRVAFAMAGFFAGGYLALSAAAHFELGSSTALICFAVVGVVSAVIAAMVMDWAIIALTALAGAGAVVLALHLSPTVSLVTFLVLAVVGMVFQGQALEKSAGEASG